MALSDAACRKAAAREKPFKLYDSGGLFLFVSPSGGKLWRMRYQMSGKERLLSFGPYPEVGLAAARAARDDARATLRTGRDPGLDKAQRRANAASADRSFEVIARAWHASQASTWTARHAADVLHSLDAYAFPKIGRLDVAEITPPMVLDLLRVIERRPAVETAHRVRQRISGVFVHAIASGIATHDPAAIVRAALKPVKKGRQPAILVLQDARHMLAAIEAQPAHPVTKLALRFLALTSVRPGEVRGAEWAEIEGDLWRVPAARMKMRRDHLVPLSRQAVDVIDAVRQVSGRGPLVFPSTRWAHRPLSENALGYLMNRAGYAGKAVPHGWRATFSSVMNERYRADRAVIDLMLAHVTGGTEAAYNRAAHFDRRRELAQEWADLLMEGSGDATGLLGLARR